jgi:tRNA pseudouridine38-40 synthase
MAGGGAKAPRLRLFFAPGRDTPAREGMRGREIVMRKRRIKATVSYDGTGYQGFQLQPDGVTIQSVIEKTLASLLREPVRIRPAGRTDTGVHARRQVVDFADSGKRSLEAIVRGGNALLPPEIRILSAEEVPLAFDARRYAKSKEYRYFLHNAPVSSPFLARYAWHVTSPLDLGAMREGLAHIVGSHDFASFRGQGCAARTTIREIYRAGIGAAADLGLHCVMIAGSGFLRHMVRNVVGTLVDIGRRKIPPDRMRELLGLKDRTLAGATAPPHGLFLWEVFYGSPPDAGTGGERAGKEGFSS